MSTQELLAVIDSEISTLRQVRALLAGQGSAGSRRGRQPMRRTLSAEARAKIAAAQKRRWAKVRNAEKR